MVPTCLYAQIAGIDNALESLTNTIVEARGIAIACELIFEYVIINDDLKLLTSLNNVRRKQFQRTRYPDMEMIWQDLQKNKLENVLLNKETKI